MSTRSPGRSPLWIKPKSATRSTPYSKRISKCASRTCWPLRTRRMPIWPKRSLQPVTMRTQQAHPETRPDVLEALSKPLPDDPKQFHDLWEKLTPEEKDALYRRDHSIGNHNGMPTVDRDYYNRLALGDELNQARAAQASADALKNQHPDWAQGHGIPPPNKPGAIFDDRLKYEAWQRQYNDALNGAKFLPDLQAVDKAVGDNPNRKLMLLDTHSGSQAHAAIAIGDPDTAQHISVTTPGLNTTVHGSIGSMTEEATNLRQESLRQLQNTPGHALDSVSTIAWIGYDAPQVPGGTTPRVPSTVCGASATIISPTPARTTSRVLRRHRGQPPRCADGTHGDRPLLRLADHWTGIAGTRQPWRDQCHLLWLTRHRSLNTRTIAPAAWTRFHHGDPR